MLTALSIRDVVLIETLDLEVGPGLGVLTGETGAGKSILLDALGLALGARADSGLVRDGQAQAVVTVTFDLPPGHAAWPLLDENGLAGEPGEPLVIRRIAKADGGSRAFVNDQPASAGLLRELGATLVEIHGQHDDRGLLNPRGHRALLDAYGSLDTGAVAAAYRAVQEAKATLAAARGRSHLLIEKSHAGTATRTSVHALDDAKRREEIARMLSGAQVTDEARAQASRLLEAA